MRTMYIWNYKYFCHFLLLLPTIRIFRTVELFGNFEQFNIKIILKVQLFDYSEQLNINLFLLQQIIIVDNLHRKWAFQDFAVNRLQRSNYNSFLVISTWVFSFGSFNKFFNSFIWKLITCFFYWNLSEQTPKTWRSLRARPIKKFMK